jgi:hypothetical protein
MREEFLIIIIFFLLSLGMPAIILLCRGVFGKNVWTLNFRYNPLSNVSIQRNKVLSLIFQLEKQKIFFFLFSRKNAC